MMADAFLWFRRLAAADRRKYRLFTPRPSFGHEKSALPKSC
jgi:hypothetical protein